MQPKLNFIPFTQELFNNMRFYMRSTGIENEGSVIYEDDYIQERRYKIFLLNHDGYAYAAEMVMSDAWNIDNNAPMEIYVLEKFKTYTQKSYSTSSPKNMTKLFNKIQNDGFVKIALPEPTNNLKFKYVEEV